MSIHYPRWLRIAGVLIAICFVSLALLVFVHYPRNTDSVEDRSGSSVRKDYLAFYDDAYKAPGDAVDPAISKSYSARSAAPEEMPLDPTQRWIKEELASFIRKYELQDKRALEVGAGSGPLQDVVRDYTGLDISSTAKRFFHKPFVEASATNLPFRDNSFDLVWSVFVLEHVPRPEQALSEMRRVVRDGGYLFLAPRWQCRSWAAEGYDARPYSDFNWRGKIIKASIPFRDTVIYRAYWTLPVRVLRYLSFAWNGRPTAFHYTALTPNYSHYWEADSDAVNSMDSFEAILWHESRGDQCVNFDGSVRKFFASGPIIIRVNKKPPSR